MNVNIYNQNILITTQFASVVLPQREGFTRHDVSDLRLLVFEGLFWVDQKLSLAQNRHEPHPHYRFHRRDLVKYKAHSTSIGDRNEDMAGGLTDMHILRMNISPPLHNRLDNAEETEENLFLVF